MIVDDEDDVAEDLAAKVKKEHRDTNFNSNQIELRNGKIGRLILGDDNLDAQVKFSDTF